MYDVMELFMRIDSGIGLGKGGRRGRRGRGLLKSNVGLRVVGNYIKQSYTLYPTS